jgi:hypothetical protein
MGQHIGTVRIQDNKGDLLLERTLEGDSRFRVSREVPVIECFFSFRPNGVEDINACMAKALEWSMEKISLGFVSGGFYYRECLIAEFAYDAKSDCIKIKAEARDFEATRQGRKGGFGI